MEKRFTVTYTSSESGETFTTPALTTSIVQHFLKSDDDGTIDIISIQGVK